MPVKCKDSICPTISCVIGQFNIEKALLNLGTSVYLLPFSVYKQQGLAELKPTAVYITIGI